MATRPVSRRRRSPAGASLRSLDQPAATQNPSSVAWRRSVSNRRPPACKAGALPLSYAPTSQPDEQVNLSAGSQNPQDPVVGQGGLEPPTPRLSSVCSNQLSYWPAGPRARNTIPTNNRKDARPAPRWKPTGTRPHPEPSRTAGYRHEQVDLIGSSVMSGSSAARSGEPALPHEHSLKGGDPAAGSPTATLLRLHPSR